MGKGTTIQYPAQSERSYSEGLKESLQAQVSMAPALYGAEASAEFGRPAYAQLETKIMEDTLLGAMIPPKGAIKMTSDAQRWKIYGKANSDLKEYSEEQLRAHWKHVKTLASKKGASKKQKNDWANRKKRMPPKVGNYYNPKTKTTIKESQLKRDPKGGLINLVGSTKELEDGRKPGFDLGGKFMGMTQLGEDLRQQATSAQREGDIADADANVATYKTLMEKVRPETEKQLGAAVTVLQEEATRLSGDPDYLTKPDNLQEIVQGLQKEGTLTQLTEQARVSSGVIDLGERERGKQLGVPWRDPARQVSIDRRKTGPQMIREERGPIERMSELERERGKQLGVPWRDPARQVSIDRRKPGPEMIREERGPIERMSTLERGTTPQMIGEERGPIERMSTLERGTTQQMIAGQRGPLDQMSILERGPTERLGGYADLQDPFGLRSTMQQQAAEDLAAGGGLTPRQRRDAEQAARRWGQAAGRELDPLAAVREVEEVMRAQGAEQDRRRGYAGQVLGQEAALQTGELGRGMQQAQVNIQNEVARLEANYGRQLTAEEFNAVQEAQRQRENISTGMGAQQVNIQNEVARLEANYGRQLTSEEFNSLQQSMRQEANIGRQMGAQQFNIQNEVARLEANYGRQLSAEEFNSLQQSMRERENIATGMGTQQFNIQNEVARQEANIGRKLTTEELNLVQETARQESNIGRQMRAQQFNIQNEVARLEANYGRQLSAEEFNSLQESMRERENIATGMGAQQFNIQNEVARQEANIGRKLTTEELNLVQETARQEANIGRQMGAQQFNIGTAIDLQRENLGRRAAEQEFNILQDVGLQESNLAREMDRQRFNIGQEVDWRSGDIGREMTAATTDVGQLMNQEQMNEQLRQRGIGGYLGGVGQVAGMEGQVYGDPLQAIIGRPAGTTGFGIGQQMYGGAGSALSAGPGVAFNPEAGLNYMLGQQGNRANFAAAQAGAQAQRGAGIFGGIGQMAGGFLGNPGIFK